MAHVDTQSGKIYGAKEGSLVWFHEIGHLEFKDSSIGSTIHYWQGVLFLALITCIVTTFFEQSFKWIAFLLLIIYFIIDIYEEIWCWAYAYKKKRENEWKYSR